MHTPDLATGGFKRGNPAFSDPDAIPGKATRFKPGNPGKPKGAAPIGKRRARKLAKLAIIAKAGQACAGLRRRCAGVYAGSLLILLCHKNSLVRFDSRCVRMEILARGGGVWVSNPADTAANHDSRPMSRH